MKIVVYHADCPDGFGAAYAAWLCFKERGELDQVSFIPRRYGDAPPPVCPGDEMYIFDFSFPRAVLEDLYINLGSKNLIICDHHKTAQGDLADLPYAHFDMSKSGAVLAWEYLFPDEPVPNMLKYIQDRDLWQWKMENSREVSAFLHSYPQDFDIWDNTRRREFSGMVAEGAAILRSKNQQVERNIKNVFFTVVGTTVVPVVNTNTEISDTCNELCKRYPDYPFAAAYFDLVGKRKWSLRSIGDFDVSEICKKLGGGGHKNAAGFETLIPTISAAYDHVKLS